MGDTRKYNESGGFYEYQYHQVGETITASNGVSGKVITKHDETVPFHSSLPLFADKSEIYLKRSDDKEAGHPIEQARVYKDRKAAFDFDWGHQHPQKPKPGEKQYPEGVVHVHIWGINKKGEWGQNRSPLHE